MRARFMAIVIALTVIGATVASPALADQGKTHATVPQTAEGEGVIRAIDRGASSITLRHDPIAALGWPAMTMAFPVHSPDLLTDLAVGQRVHFVLMNQGGKPMISEIQVR
jgi:Cu(I)/Ag(I) efflux system protein CusF